MLDERITSAFPAAAPGGLILPVTSSDLRWNQLSARRAAGWALRLCLVLFPALVAALGVASPATAHFKLTEAVPASGARVDRPVTEIRLRFSAGGTPVGAGFKLFDGKGGAVPVSRHSPDSGRTWLVHPSAPLGTGAFELQWSVAAPDAHPLTGTLTFTVTSTADPRASPDSPATTGPQGHHGHSGHGMPSAEPAAPTAGHTGDHSGNAEQASVQFVGALGRWASYGAIMLGVGGLIFALTTLVGTRSDIRVVQIWVRASSLAVAAGATLELCALAATFSEDGAFASAISAHALSALSQNPAGASLALRFTGAAGLLTAGSLEVALIRGRHAVGRHSVPTVAAIPVAAGPVSTSATAEPAEVDVERVRARPIRPILLAATVALLLASFLLDGHTVTAEPRAVVVFADVAHTIAAAVWVGGVLLLTVLLLSRARRGIPTGAAEMAVRFSIPATAAVALTGIAGVALAMLILDGPAELVTTTWGRVLLVKIVLVTGVALVGLYNSREVVPMLDQRALDPTHRLRRVVLVEAVLMLAVVLVTAILVNSGT
ncbi:CopD family protein [Micromonospora purpureochromogenes]|uniref:copper resistance CopC/CopD family protein n=1 Tax=Micromonospora purpureochromogenes TaxID=47872 RepID=UPI0033200E43